MEEHVHGFATGHCQHGLFPELATNNFPLFQTRSYQVRDSFLPTVRRLQCRVLQMTLDVIDLFLLEILRPILWGASNLHFICAHGHHHGDLHRQSLENVFQAARRFDASKQHRRSIRRFADHGSVQWPLLYGPETVRVPTGNAVQIIPTFFVGVSLPDIFFALRSPLTSASGHGCHCDRTNVSYLEHDASYLTNPHAQCTTTDHWSASHASDDNASTMQEKNYLPRQRSANAQLQVIVSIYRYSTQRCLQPQVR